MRAADIGIVPAAAGGPKGLIFRALDQWVFGGWFPAAPRERTLIGSSIGAWRMAAACQRDPVTAFARLGELYSGQRYTSTKPSPAARSTRWCRACWANSCAATRTTSSTIPHHRLHLLTVRGKRRPGRARPDRHAEMRGFAAAALHNLASRDTPGAA